MDFKYTIPTDCPTCGGEVRHIPAGVSKRTGNAYSDFYACSDRECKFTYRNPSGKVEKEEVVLTQNEQSANTRETLKAILQEVVEIKQELMRRDADEQKEE